MVLLAILHSCWGLKWAYLHADDTYLDPPTTEISLESLTPKAPVVGFGCGL